MEKEIKELKKRLNEAVEENQLNNELILDLSRKLDELIVKYYEKNQKIAIDEQHW